MNCNTLVGAGAAEGAIDAQNLFETSFMARENF